MLFMFALISNFLLASVVLAHRHHKHTDSQPLDDVKSNGDVLLSESWAGIVLDGSFFYVSGTFTVPHAFGRSGSGASIWIGIDGNTCENALLQTGIYINVGENNVPSYSAFYQWVPDYSRGYDSDISISARDVIRVSVTMYSGTTGITKIENLTTGKSASQHLESNATLCGKNVEWIVEDFMVIRDSTGKGKHVPLANFGTVTFTNTVATGTSSGNYTLSGAGVNVFAICQNGKTMTSTLVDPSSESITIKHV